MDPIEKLQRCLEMSGLKEETCQSYTYKINIFLRTIDKGIIGTQKHSKYKYISSYGIIFLNEHKKSI